MLCRGVNLRRATAVMGQARKSAHGAGAQVQDLFVTPAIFFVCSLSHSVCAKACLVLYALLMQEL